MHSTQHPTQRPDDFCSSENRWADIRDAFEAANSRPPQYFTVELGAHQQDFPARKTNSISSAAAPIEGASNLVGTRLFLQKIHLGLETGRGSDEFVFDWPVTIGVPPRSQFFERDQTLESLLA